MIWYHMKLYSRNFVGPDLGGRFLEFLRALYGSSKMQPRGTSTSVPVERGAASGMSYVPKPVQFLHQRYFEDLDGFTPAGVIVPSNSPDDLRCPGLLFADDVVLMAESADDLKAALMHVERWADRWGWNVVCEMWDNVVPTTLPSESIATLTELRTLAAARPRCSNRRLYRTSVRVHYNDGCRIVTWLVARREAGFGGRPSQPG